MTRSARDVMLRDLARHACGLLLQSDFYIDVRSSSQQRSHGLLPVRLQTLEGGRALRQLSSDCGRIRIANGRRRHSPELAESNSGVEITDESPIKLLMRLS